MIFALLKAKILVYVQKNEKQIKAKSRLLFAKFLQTYLVTIDNHSTNTAVSLELYFFQHDLYNALHNLEVTFFEVHI